MSARSSASLIEWVTKMTVFLKRAQMRRSSSCITERVCASSAPKGSSISRICGSTASARAIDTRCFIPPERWCGYFSANCAVPRP